MSNSGADHDFGPDFKFDFCFFLLQSAPCSTSRRLAAARCPLLFTLARLPPTFAKQPLMRRMIGWFEAVLALWLVWLPVRRSKTHCPPHSVQIHDRGLVLVLAHNAAPSQSEPHAPVRFGHSLSGIDTWVCPTGVYACTKREGLRCEVLFDAHETSRICRASGSLEPCFGYA